jgi:aspartyl-tRNA(Asn)/glutamyl-tRNA(Gln) amidotransferase subunit A
MLGAAVDEVDPGFADPIETFNILWYAGAAKLLDSIPEGKRAQVDPGLRAIAEKGRDISIVAYMRAMDARAAIGELMGKFHRTYDLLVTPMLPITAFAAGRNAPQGDKDGDWVAWTPFTFPFNLTQQPAASIPCGLADDGLPVGLHVVAAKFEDALVMRACAALERAMPPAFPKAPKVG